MQISKASILLGAKSGAIVMCERVLTHNNVVSGLSGGNADLINVRPYGYHFGMATSRPSAKYKDLKSGTEWANEHTFHIAFWMLNDVAAYQSMRKFMQDFNGPIPYRAWIKEMGLVDESTPNGWKFMADGVHYGDLSEIMRASMY